MRFRAPNTGAQQAADGIGNFFRAQAMAPMAAAQAAEEAAMQRQKSDLLGAQTQQSQAHAALFNTQAQSERDQQQRGTLPEMIKMGAHMYGVPPSQTEDFAKFAQTGQMPSRYQPPPVDGVGPYEPAPAFYTDGTAEKIWKQLGLTQQALTVGDKSVENIAKAAGAYRDQGLGDRVLAGQLDPGRVAEAQAAMGGKDRFSNIESTGRGFNKFTGAEQSLSPDLSVLFDKKTGAAIGKDNAAAGASRASAANSFASAGQHRAATDKLRMEISQGGSTGQVQVVPAADGSVMLVNKATGEARPAIGPDGKPVQGKGPPVKALPASTAKGYLDNITNLRRAEKALSLVSGGVFDGATGDKTATGWKGVLPNMILNRLDPNGVDTRAAIADLGSLVIHDRSGAAVTASETPRLAPFIPNVYDDQETARKKLAQFVANYRAIVEDSASFYRDSGYSVPAVDGAWDQSGTPKQLDPLGIRR